MPTPATYCTVCRRWLIGGCHQGHQPVAQPAAQPTVITKSPPAKKGGKK